MSPRYLVRGFLWFLGNGLYFYYKIDPQINKMYPWRKKWTGHAPIIKDYNETWIIIKIWLRLDTHWINSKGSSCSAQEYTVICTLTVRVFVLCCWWVADWLFYYGNGNTFTHINSWLNNHIIESHAETNDENVLYDNTHN